MDNRRKASASEVLRRMKAGDLPHLRGGYTDGSAFDDGTLVQGQTMRRLFKADKILRPEGTSIQATWKLTEKEDSNG